MAHIGKTIRAILLADATITSAVGVRIHSDAVPQGARHGAGLPAISYRVIDTVPTEHLGGVADITRARIEINAHATKRSEAVSIAQKVRIALQMKHRGTSDSQDIQEISLASGDKYTMDRAEKGSDLRRYVTSQDFFVSYRPAT